MYDENYKSKAREMAENVVAAFIEHDRKDYDRSAELFSSVYSGLFPEADGYSVSVAGRAYADALKQHDEIEESGLQKIEWLKSPKWNDVYNSLLGLCDSLDVPSDYAKETTEFFRYHGIGDERYKLHCLRADGILTASILGTDYWSNVLGPLYLACVDCHDKHDEKGARLGKYLIEIYYGIILENRKYDD